MSEPTELSDEALARILFREECPECFGEWEDAPLAHETYLRQARAIRAALTPAVTPLAAGEMVTIPTVNGMETGGLRIMGSARAMALSIESPDGWWDSRFLDAAGVRQLELACRRARAAMEGDEHE